MSPGADRFRILVAVENVDTARALIDFAAMVARTRGGELILLHVPTPSGRAGRDSAAGGPHAAAEGQAARPVTRSLADHDSALAEDPVPAVREEPGRSEGSPADPLAELAETHELPYEASVRVDTDPARAILRGARGRDADLIVMGWSGRSRHPEATIGSTIDRVLAEAASHVAVLRASSLGPPARVLIPVADPRQARLMLDIGEMFRDHFSSTLFVWHAIPPGMSEEARKTRLRILGEGLGLVSAEGRPGVPRPILEVEETREIVERIAELASQHNLTIVGARGGDPASLGMTGADLARIAEGSTGRLLLVRRRPDSAPIAPREGASENDG